MLIQALQFVIESIARFFILLFVLRFFMQVARIPFQQPMGQFVVKMTNWLVMPLRKVIPGWMGYDLASLTGGFLIGMLLHALLFFLLGAISRADVWVAILALTLFGVLELIRLTIYSLIGAVIVQAVLSWTNPYHPFAVTVHKLTAPLLKPIQRYVPPVANIDLSPLILLLFLQVLLIAPVQWVESRLWILLQFGQ